MESTTGASMESARLTPTPSGKSLTGFPWPMLTPPDTRTTLVLSLESATLATGTGMESTTGSARLRRTLSGRWPTVAPGESSPVLTTATDMLLATEPLETVVLAMLAISMDKKLILETENISGLLKKK